MGSSQSLAIDHTDRRPGWFSNAFRTPSQLATPEGPSLVLVPEHADGSGPVAEPVADKGPEPVAVAEIESAQHPAPRDKEALLGHIRHSIAALRTSEQSVSDLRAGLATVTERAKNEVAAANARAEAAELRAASEAARANAAEQRWLKSEARFGEILQVIANELDAPL